MIPMIEQHRAAVHDLCRRYRVKRLEVFGSAAEADRDDDAHDVDFLVEFDAAPDLGPVDQCFGLLEDLERLYGRPVDLLCAGAMRNPWLIREINRSRNLLYAA